MQKPSQTKGYQLKFRNILAIAGFALAAVGTSAFAQFDGIYAGAGLSFTKGTMEFDNGGGTVGDNKHRMGLNLNVGYGHSFGNFNLAGELSYADKLGRIDSVSLGGPSANLEKAWALSVLPGFKVGNNALLFGRVGWAQAKTAGSAFTTANIGAGSQKHDGTLWGIGGKYAFTRNVSAVVEYQVYDLNSKSYAGQGVKPQSTGIVLGVQYAF